MGSNAPGRRVPPTEGERCGSGLHLFEWVLARESFVFRRMSAIEELRKTIARLRAPGGCPWDQEQTHASLTRCLIDECSELLDTIDRMDLPHMREELGDVLIQVIFHAQIAEEAGHFNLEDVAREVNEKLIRRHPHVFGDHAKLGTGAEVVVKWEEIKAQEKAAKGQTAEQESVFKELPPRLPALMFAEAIWKQIEKKKLPVGEDVNTTRIHALGADLNTVELGRLLFELAAASRVKGLDPEGALRLYTERVKADVEKRAHAK
jgi:MazG family protein